MSLAQEDPERKGGRNPFRLRSVHDGLGQMMRPGRGVIGEPEARVDLGNDDFVFRRALFVDFFA
jgi:hypothetical protein